MRLRRTIGFLAVVGLASGPCLAQGLGDAAAREKQKRAKGGKASTPVVTDEGLQKYAGERPMIEASSSSGSQAAPAEEATSEEPPTSTSSSNEDPDALKKQRAAEYKERLAVAREQVAEAEANLKEAEEWLQKHYGGATMDSATVAVSRSQIESARRKLDVARQYETDLLDAARRERIPPGWLR